MVYGCKLLLTFAWRSWLECVFRSLCGVYPEAELLCLATVTVLLYISSSNALFYTQVPPSGPQFWEEPWASGTEFVPTRCVHIQYCLHSHGLFIWLGNGAERSSHLPQATWLMDG